MWPFVRDYADTTVRKQIEEKVRPHMDSFELQSLDLGDIVCYVMLLLCDAM